MQIGTGFGLAGASLVIILLVIKSFLEAQKKNQDSFLESQKKNQEFLVDAINKKDVLLSNQHTEIKDLAERSNTAIIKFTEALTTNTQTNRANADNLTKVVFELITKKEKL